MRASDDDTHRGDGGFFPPPTAPRTVSGGIRAQARGTQPGTTWWARRWFAALDALGIGDRLERGRSYARGGQVVAFELQLGAVTAIVQGTRRTPYDTRIEVERLTQLEWLDVARSLASRASYRATLLGGTMPEDIEAVFAATGVSLFPRLEDDLQISCTCNDWASPCKHAAAVCFLLAEALDRDPFTIFLLRGIEREVLLAMLDGSAAHPEAAAPCAPALAQPLDVDGFWGHAAGGSGMRVAIDTQPPVLDAPLVRLLGAPALWRGSEDFLTVMTRLYARIGSDPRTVDAAIGGRRRNCGPGRA